MRIDTKSQFYALWNANKLGNKLRSWKTLAEFHASGYRGVVGLRAVLATGGGPLLIVPNSDDLPAAFKHFASLGVPVSSTVICEGAPDERVRLQGEVMRGPQLSLFANAEGRGLRMRESMLDAKTYAGLAAQMLLRRHLTPASYDDIQELLDLYPDSVIEFSAYDHNLGWAAGRNTLIWEVRNY